jgi:catechol 2,3-dioxygenase-like lactoylglutathione lyase family enzyme
MLNVVVRDIAASLDFYRRLGIAVPAPGDAAGAYVQLKMPGGFSLELDTAGSARSDGLSEIPDRGHGTEQGRRCRP